MESSTMSTQELSSANSQKLTASNPAGHCGSLKRGRTRGRPRKRINPRMCGVCGVRPTMTEKHRRCRCCFGKLLPLASTRLCCKCNKEPRRVTKSGNTSSRCATCESLYGKKGKIVAVEPPQPVLPTRYVRPAAPEPQYRTFGFTGRIAQPVRRNFDGTPVQQPGYSTVRVVPESELDDFKRKIRQQFPVVNNGAAVCATKQEQTI